MLDLYADLYVNGQHWTSVCYQWDMLKRHFDLALIPEIVHFTYRESLVLVFKRAELVDLEELRAMAPERDHPDRNPFNDYRFRVKHHVRFDYQFSMHLAKQRGDDSYALLWKKFIDLQCVNARPGINDSQIVDGEVVSDNA